MFSTEKRAVKIDRKVTPCIYRMGRPFARHEIEYAMTMFSSGNTIMKNTYVNK